jgi:hypothetical protein
MVIKTPSPVAPRKSPAPKPAKPPAKPAPKPSKNSPRLKLTFVGKYSKFVFKFQLRTNSREEFSSEAEWNLIAESQNLSFNWTICKLFILPANWIGVWSFWTRCIVVFQVLVDKEVENDLVLVISSLEIRMQASSQKRWCRFG